MAGKRGWKQSGSAGDWRIFPSVDPMISIGEEAPNFQLNDLAGNPLSLGELRGRIVVLNFWSAECQWCERVDREILACLENWHEEVIVLWIACNVNESHDLIRQVAVQRNLPIMLLDFQQHVADLFGAQTTPYFFVVDTKGYLSYRGTWDDVTFRQRVAQRFYLSEAVEALRGNVTPEITETPPYGCMIVRFSQ
jgi:peroxiredoxin